MLPEGPYNPKSTEQKILQYWLGNNFYSSNKQNDSDNRPTWSIICPPPNAYGRPHVGNISGYAYIDAMARYQRMQGKRVLVMPGKDHAGLEGEGVFVREVLEKQGKRKFDLTRDDFYNQMMAWMRENMQKAQTDEKTIGLSADFDKDIFTLDPKIVTQVTSTFVEMYNQGLIYKGVRIVNWDPKAKTAVADNQMERESVEGNFYYINYPLADGSGNLTVATTRPETMFGDTALAINPTDERYQHLIGKLVTIPLTNIQIPVISDWRVSKEEGTGCLKITPAHSAEDYEIRLSWNKAYPDKQIGINTVIDKELKFLTNVPAQFAGRKYKECLPEIEELLKSGNHLINIEKKQKNILISERTKAPIEPLLSSQWYLSYDVVTAQGKSLRQAAIDMVKNDEIIIHPESQKQAFLYWMENIRDWAISRSLWWGYRLPVWYNGQVTEQIMPNGEVNETINNEVLDYANPNHVKVQLESPGPGWNQDENVLDTWFSSGQWVYTTLQAHNLTEDFILPTDVMLSGYDILQNWISRMVMFTYFKHGKPAFKDVYLTGLVQGTDGQKMSKSRGNIIDIDKIKEDYGTDALRLAYFYQNSAGASYALTLDKLKNFKQFNNKLWNASKFVLMHAQSYEVSINNLPINTNVEFVNKLKTHIQQVKPQIKALIDSFEFGKATEEIYHSFWHDFCDLLIEESKPFLQPVLNPETKEVISTPDENIAKQVSFYMLFALVEYLKMLHPFAPFITEEIWQSIIQNPSKPLMHETF